MTAMNQAFLAVRFRTTIRDRLPIWEFPMDEAERHELGLATRRAVLGDAYVDHAMNTRTPFNTEFQDVLNRQCWGEIWTRTAIDEQTRRLITIGMLIALNREDEFKTHVRTALEHGMAPDLVKEVILHSWVYCGVPAANSAFKAAGAILAELKLDQ